MEGTGPNHGGRSGQLSELERVSIQRHLIAAPAAHHRPDRSGISRSARARPRVTRLGLPSPNCWSTGASSAAFCTPVHTPTTLAHAESTGSIPFLQPTSVPRAAIFLMMLCERRSRGASERVRRARRALHLSRPPRRPTLRRDQPRRAPLRDDLRVRVRFGRANRCSWHAAHSRCRG